MSEFGRILGELYRKQYENQFKYHPDKDKIVDALCTGDFESTEQVDKWFTEAAKYSMQNTMEMAEKFKKNGTVIFKMHKDNELD